MFLLRARPDAILHAHGLDSPLLPDEDDEAISVAEFFRRVYLQRSSANFAHKGQGLPLANLKGIEIKESDKGDAWKEEKLQQEEL